MTSVGGARSTYAVVPSFGCTIEQSWQLAQHSDVLVGVAVFGGSEQALDVRLGQTFGPRGFCAL